MKYRDIIIAGILLSVGLSFSGCNQGKQKADQSISEIREFVFNEPLFDSHDHQVGYNQEWDKKTYEEFIDYAQFDMKIAGGAKKLGDVENNFSKWMYIRTTGYGQAASLATNKLFNLDYSKENADNITDAVREFVRDKNPETIYKELYGIANISGVVNDLGKGDLTRLDYYTENQHPDFIKKAMRAGDSEIFMLSSSSQIRDLENKYNKSFQKLSDLDLFLDDYTQKVYRTGNLIAFKTAIAYNRYLDFEDVSYSEANEVYLKILQDEEIDTTPLSDYLVHKFFQRAERFNLPVQIHTGLQAGTGYGDIRGTNPALLIPIFNKYKNVRFDVFHAGWPYSEELGAIAKHHPNVWLDMCWAWAINPVQMERILDEWLACVPCNKIFTFGADAWSPFITIGYAEQTRNGIANVLEKKIESGEYDLETAKFVAERIMHKNAEEFFGFK